MGMFSWLDCRTNRQILCGVERNSYLLVPEEFGGGHICEPCYDGYGRFGNCDVYEEVAKWNRSELSGFTFEEPKRDDYSDEFYYDLAVRRYNAQTQRIRDFAAGMSHENMIAKYGKDYLREIGIDIACYDEDNAALKYPIKISRNSRAKYEDCAPSLSDPDQGCR